MSLALLTNRYLNRSADMLASVLYVLKRDNGTPVPMETLVFPGTCTSGNTSGIFLYRKSDGTYDKADPAVPAKMPATAYLDTLLTTTAFAGRPLSHLAEVAIGTTLTPGALYVVGTDGLPAKVGDANYPVTGQRQVVGSAVDAKYLRFEPGLSGLGDGAGGLIGKTAENSVLDLSASTALTQLETFSIPAGFIKLGRMYALEGCIKHAAGVSSSNFAGTLNIATIALLTSSLFNVVDAGDITHMGVQFIARAVGASGSMLIQNAWARCNATAGCTVPAAGTFALNTTIANAAEMFGQFSASSAGDHARAESLTLRQLA